jgi:hypothetical protein
MKRFISISIRSNQPGLELRLRGEMEGLAV